MEQPKETIIQKAYDLLKFGIVLVGQFPQKHKFTLGDRMQGHLSDVLEIFLPLLAVLANNCNVGSTCFKPSGQAPFTALMKIFGA